MSGLIIALIATGALSIPTGVYFFWSKDHPNKPSWEMNTQKTVAGVLSICLLVLTLVLAFMAIMPQYRLYRATVEKRILVEQARAEADAAVDLKRAEVTRAEGVAEANVIIADSIDEQYIRWLYVQNLADHNASEIIYIPTEGGLPIFEAPRAGSAVSGGDE